MAAAKTVAAEPAPASLEERVRDVWREAAGGGAVLPSEPVLAKALGVSRTALREALVRLSAEGLIDRRQGANTALNRSALEMPVRLDRQIPFEKSLAQAGYVAELEVLDHEEIQLDDAAAASLQRPVGSTALRTSKRWLADGSVAMLAIDVLPVPDGVDPGSVDPLMSVFEATAMLFGETATWESAWPRPCNVDAAQAAWLRQPVGTAVLALDLVGVSRSGHRCYLATEYHVPGLVPQGFIRTLM